MYLLFADTHCTQLQEEIDVIGALMMSLQEKNCEI